MLKKILWLKHKFDVEAAGEFEGDHEDFFLRSLDGEVLYGTRLEGDGDLAFLVVHGLFAHHRAPGFKEFAEALTPHGDVYAIDLRGHGRSSGRSTLGNREALDVAAATGHIRRQTGVPLVVIGFSMGAAASVRSAGLLAPAEAVVSVSGPSRWHGPRHWAAKRTALAWKVPGFHLAARAATGVRIDPRWAPSEPPHEAAAGIAPAPLLVVHGTADTFFPPEEARHLYDSASEPKGLWMIPDGGHAEGLFTEAAEPVSRPRVDDFTGELVSRLRDLVAGHTRREALGGGSE